MYEANTAEINNFWKLWSIILFIYHLHIQVPSLLPSLSFFVSNKACILKASKTFSQISSEKNVIARTCLSEAIKSLVAVHYRKSCSIPWRCDNLFEVKNIKNIKLSFHSGKISNYTASGKENGKVVTCSTLVIQLESVDTVQSLSCTINSQFFLAPWVVGWPTSKKGLNKKV